MGGGRWRVDFPNWDVKAWQVDLVIWWLEGLEGLIGGLGELWGTVSQPKVVLTKKGLVLMVCSYFFFFFFVLGIVMTKGWQSWWF